MKIQTDTINLFTTHHYSILTKPFSYCISFLLFRLWLWMTWNKSHIEMAVMWPKANHSIGRWEKLPIGKRPWCVCAPCVCSNALTSVCWSYKTNTIFLRYVNWISIRLALSLGHFDLSLGKHISFGADKLAILFEWLGCWRHIRNGIKLEINFISSIAAQYDQVKGWACVVVRRKQ